jgi:hypothetical protein
LLPRSLMMLDGLQLVLLAALCDGLAFDPFCGRIIWPRPM